MAFGGLRGVRRRVVGGLAWACERVDTLMYRPLVVRATERLPVFWHCQLCQFSQWLDGRWQTAYWDDTRFWVADLCDACGRRAAWTTLGGPMEDEETDPDDYWDSVVVHLCGWCDIDRDVRDAKDLALGLAEARARSVCWRWPRPTG